MLSYTSSGLALTLLILIVVISVADIFPQVSIQQHCCLQYLSNYVYGLTLVIPKSQIFEKFFGHFYEARDNVKYIHLN